MIIQTLGERKKEIRLLMKYAVPEKNLEKAKSFVNMYENDAIALNLFHSFYSFLPDAHDDFIEELHLLIRKQGIFLICATTMYADYIYLVTNERAEFLGKLADGIWDKEVLKFFRIVDQDTFIDKYGDLSNTSIYTPAGANKKLCPVCSAASGEHHTYGCPLEICPWCDGQLKKCNCRFTLMNKDRLEKESHIDAFQKLLIEKGRIPFDAARDIPEYPVSADSLISDES
ncbi:MAG: hypothetical protein U9O82_10425 [Thermodesulfobacteriota bacterium]|nr:hypothetical protein [Thermodesulfobacteriota bacterium]